MNKDEQVLYKRCTRSTKTTCHNEIHLILWIAFEPSATSHKPDDILHSVDAISIATDAISYHIHAISYEPMDVSNDAGESSSEANDKSTETNDVFTAPDLTRNEAYAISMSAGNTLNGVGESTTAADTIS